MFSSICRFRFYFCYYFLNIFYIKYKEFINLSYYFYCWKQNNLVPISFRIATISLILGVCLIYQNLRNKIYSIILYWCFSLLFSRILKYYYLLTHPFISWVNNFLLNIELHLGLFRDLEEKLGMEPIQTPGSQNIYFTGRTRENKLRNKM